MTAAERGARTALTFDLLRRQQGGVRGAQRRHLLHGDRRQLADDPNLGRRLTETHSTVTQNRGRTATELRTPSAAGTLSRGRTAVELCTATFQDKSTGAKYPISQISIKPCKWVILGFESHCASFSSTGVTVSELRFHRAFPQSSVAELFF